MSISNLHTPEQVKAIFDSPSAKAIDEFLALMEDSETPRVYLTWSLITSVSALLGRNCVLRSGPLLAIRPNLFTVLLGPAGVRKSSAINAILGMLKRTSLHFGPTDTGGQRHGLMAALGGLRLGNSYQPDDSDDIFPIQLTASQTRKPSDIFLVAGELGRLLGSTNREMADFLVDLWDGEDIKYQTKVGETRIRQPLASMLGATTPSSLAGMLPENAAGHGILSRILFIYDDSKYKSVPLPADPKEEWWDAKNEYEERLRRIDNYRGDFGLKSCARQSFINLYKYVPELSDPRLAHYKERRPTILLKVSMALAALRGSMMIQKSDILLSHELMVAVEPNMSKALEYFGRNKALQGRMLMIQYLRDMGEGGVATEPELIAAASSELNAREGQEAVNSLLASGELVSYGPHLYLGTSSNELVKAKMKDGIK